MVKYRSNPCPLARLMAKKSAKRKQGQKAKRKVKPSLGPVVDHPTRKAELTLEPIRDDVPSPAMGPPRDDP